MKKLTGKDLSRVTKRNQAISPDAAKDGPGVDAVVVAAVASSVMKMADAVKEISAVQAKQSLEFTNHLGRKRKALFVVNRDTRGLLKSVTMEEK